VVPSAETTRICVDCQVEKPIEEFYTLRGGRYRRKNCRECFNKFQRLRRKTVLKATRQRYRRNRVLRKYDLDIESYQELLTQQDSKCAICKADVSELKRGLQVDHDHRSGKRRSLLCYSCNGMLGMANDNISTLQAAIRYLESFR
jgi:hypothetical protein